MLEEYFHKWRLKINVDKTQAITFNHKITQVPGQQLTMYGENIEEKQEVKYLGVTLDRKLLFKTHMENQRKKALAIRSIIYPYINKTNPLGINLKVALYKIYVRSIMLYAAPVWSQAANYHLKKLDVVERNTLRIILGNSSM